MTEPYGDTQVLARHLPVAPPAPPVYQPPSPSRRRRRWVVGVVLAAAAAAGVPAGLLALDDKSPADVVRHFTPSPNVVTPNAVGDVEHLQPKLRSAIERAMAAAARAGVELRVTSGWRSAKRQQQLYDEAIAKYGSPEAARQWVLPPNESAHVDGLAVDVGPAAGSDWLRANGGRFGLCQRYANEPWHFERLAGSVGSSCPALEPHA